MCELILGSSFETCSDECYAHFKSVATAAPNCSRSSYDLTLKQLDEVFVTRCEDGRANATKTYTPKTQLGLANCTNGAIHGRQDLFGRVPGMIEEGVEAAPVCNFGYDYSSREIKKKDIVGCLKARGEDLKTNTLLQSMGSQNSSSTNNSSGAMTTAPTATLTSSASAAALFMAIGVGSIVLALLSLE